MDNLLEKLKEFRSAALDHDNFDLAAILDDAIREISRLERSCESWRLDYERITSGLNKINQSIQTE